MLRRALYLTLWAALAGALLAGWSEAARVGGPELPDGDPFPLAVPPDWHQRNTGGSDGAGLCVFASMRHTGRMQRDAAFTEIFDWMKRRPGGGYPSKVDRMLDRMCAEKGLTKPAYLHSETGDLDLLERACQSGRVPGVTYGLSPTKRYNGRRIAHMVSLVYASGDTWVILDNNYPGAAAYEWMTRAEFARSHGAVGGPWAIILLDGPAPARPWN